MRSSSSSDTSPQNLGSSTRLSRRTYSKRASLHVHKRKLEIDEEESGSSEHDDGDVQGTRLVTGRKRSRSGISRGSPSPRGPSRSRAAEHKQGDGHDTFVGDRRSISISSSLPSLSSTPSPSRQTLRRTESEQVPKSQENDWPGTKHRLPTPLTPPRSTTKRLPITPGSSPRDLSSLFTAVSPGKPDEVSSRPSGLRRMLSKTQSAATSLLSPTIRFGSGQGNADAGPSTPSRRLSRTQSLIESPNPFTLFAPMDGEHEVSGGSGGRAKRTYGKTRTILGEVSLAGSPADTDPSGTSEVVKESYSELRRRYEADNSLFDVDGSSGQMQDFWLARAPQVASDMRSKGENRRFMDEVTYLIDGIVDVSHGPGLKRSSSLDILDKMQDEEWLGKMKVCGQVERVWAVLYDARSEGDEIMDAICLVYLMTLAQSGACLGLTLKSHPTSCLRLLVEQHDVKEGPLDVTPNAKYESKKLRELSQKMYPSTSRTMSRTTALYVLQNMCNDDDLPTISKEYGELKVFAKVLKSFALDMKLLRDRFDLYEKGLDLYPDDRRVDAGDVLLCLRIISSAVLHLPDERDGLVDHAADLSPALVSCLILSTEESLSNGSTAETAAESAFETLKILANLANLSEVWACAIMRVGGILALLRLMIHRDIFVARLRHTQTDIETQSSEVDTVERDGVNADEVRSLCLAILTSAIVADPLSAREVSSMRLAPECIGRAGCLRTCKCDDGITVPTYIASLYTAHESQAAEEQVDGVLKGYTALLLTKLMVGSADARTTILPLLHGDDAAASLRKLAGSLAELTELQSAVHRRLLGDEAGALDVEKEGDILSTASAELQSLIERAGP